MNISYAKIPVDTHTQDVVALSEQTENIYEAIAMVSTRANKISVEVRTELRSKLEEFASSVDTLEEIFENSEQIEVSKYYEQLPKAGMIALYEFSEGMLQYAPEKEEEEDEEENKEVIDI